MGTRLNGTLGAFRRAQGRISPHAAALPPWPPAITADCAPREEETPLYYTQSRGNRPHETAFPFVLWRYPDAHMLYQRRLALVRPL